MNGNDDARLKVLCVGHACSYSGAPISFMSVLQHLLATQPIDARIVIRKGGPLRAAYNALAPTDVFYEHYLPLGDLYAPEDRIALNRNIVFRMREFLRNGRKRKRQRQHEKRLHDELSNWKPNIIYSNTALNGDVIAALKVDAPVVVHVRELETSLRLLSRKQEREFRGRPVRYLPVSPQVESYLGKRYGLDGSVMTMIPVGLDIEHIRKKATLREPSSIRAALGIPGDAIVVGAIGSVDRRKGADLFYSAAKTVLERCPASNHVHFVWIGVGGLFNAIRSCAAREGMSSRIHYVGEQRNPYPWIRIFDLVLTPSRDDPFPRVNLEAAVFGIPAICFRDSGGSVHFVRDSAGIALPGFDADTLAEAAIGLIENEDTRKEMGKRAQQRVLSCYNIRSVGNKVADILNEIARSDCKRIGGAA